MIEAALAHVVRNRVEAAYARSDLFERRRRLMDDWARHLAQETGEDPEPVEEVDPWILPQCVAGYRTDSSSSHQQSLYIHP